MSKNALLFIISTICCCIVWLFTSCNNNNKDNNNQSINGQIRNALEICKSLEKIPSDTLNKYSQQAYTLAKVHGSEQDLLYATFYRAQYFSVIGNFDSTSFYNETIIETPIIDNDSLQIKERSLILKGTNLYRQGKLNEALDWYFTIYPQIEKSGSTIELLRLFNNIGVTNQGLLRYTEAIRWFKKMLEYDLSDKRNFEAVANYNISDCYINIKQIDSAILYCNKAIEISNEENILIIKANSLNTLAKIKTNQNKIEESKELVLKALEIHRAEHAYFYIVSDLAQLSEIYSIAKNFQEAERVGLEAIKIAKEYQLDAQIYGVYDILMEHYKLNHNYAKALELSGDLVSWLRTYNQESSTKAFAEMEVKYETAKKEQQIKDQELQLQQKNNILIGSIALLIIIILLGIIVFRSYRYKQNQKLHQAIIQEQAEATSAIIKAEEAERNRMSQTLHDGVGQLLSGLKMNLQALHERVDFQEHEKIYNNSISLLNDAVQEIRNVSHQMQPNHIINLGLQKALQGIINKLEAEQLHFTLDISDDVLIIHKDIQLILYRIFQECIHNTVKHANASEITIQLKLNAKQLIGLYNDNGVGMTHDSNNPHKGIGLSNIYSRLRYLQAKYDIVATPNKGFQLSFQIPIK